MKLIAVLSLDDDRDALHRLFRQRQIRIFSELDVTGHEPSQTRRAAADVGWFGGAQMPADSTLAFAFLKDGEAVDLLDAIDAFNQGQDAEHPIRAFQLPVERAVPSAV